MSRENILFGAGLVLIVGVLSVFFLWSGKGQGEEKRQTGEIKNDYLIGLPETSEPTTHAASQTQPGSIVHDMPAR